MRGFLSIWGWATTLAIVLVVIFISYSLNSAYAQKPFWNLQRLDQLEKNGVVAIGTSLTRHGFYYDTDFTQLAAKSGLDMDFIRFTKGSAEPSDFIDVLTDINQRHKKPKIIFLQLEPFMIKGRDHNILARTQGKIHALIRLLLPFSSKVWNNINANYPESELELLTKEASLADMKGRARNRLHQLKPLILSKNYSDLLLNLQNSGVKIIFLRMNFAAQRYTYLKPKNFRKLTSQWIKDFKAVNGFEVWDYNGLDMSYYKDSAHLNLKGRAIFSSWIITKIKQENII